MLPGLYSAILAGRLRRIRVDIDKFAATRGDRQRLLGGGDNHGSNTPISDRSLHLDTLPCVRGDTDRRFIGPRYRRVDARCRGEGTCRRIHCSGRFNGDSHSRVVVRVRVDGPQ